MFQRRTSDGVFRSGLVAAAVMLFLREPIMAPISDILSGILGVDVSGDGTYMSLVAVYYFIAGFFLVSRFKAPTSVALSVGFWTVGLELFWLIYIYFLGPIIQGAVAPAFPEVSIWLSNFGIAAMAFATIIGAFVGKIKSG